MSHSFMQDLEASYEKLSGEEQAITSKYQDLLQALNADQKNVIVSLPWYERVGGEQYQSNQIVVHRIGSDRVYFSNPLKRGDEAPNMEIEGPNMGPQRKVHTDGSQSMALLVFKQLFIMGGGEALVSPL